MKVTVKVLACFLVLISVSLPAVEAQNRFSYILSAGPNYYYGELNDGYPTHTRLIRPFFSLGLGYSLSNKFELSGNYYWGNIAGADSLSSTRFNQRRNLSFKSLVSELSLRLEYKVFPGYKRKLINPFVYGGAGWFFYNPKAEYLGKNVELQPLGTEGQNIPGNENGPYELSASSVVLGMGIYFRVNENLKIKVDAGAHITFTDYLDDVSGSYPDSLKIAAASNGELAIELSDRSNSTAYPREGAVRGNPDANDGWMHLGVGIHYNLGGDKRFRNLFRSRANCPAY